MTKNIFFNENWEIKLYWQKQVEEKISSWKEHNELQKRIPVRQDMLILQWQGNQYDYCIVTFKADPAKMMYPVLIIKRLTYCNVQVIE